MRRTVYRIVALIPAGRVMTYGQIAWTAGAPGCARQVGQAMHQAPEGLPCHRVVNHSGRTAPNWPEQRSLLEKEGVPFTAGGNVELKRCLWRPEAFFSHE